MSAAERSARREVRWRREAATTFECMLSRVRGAPSSRARAALTMARESGLDEPLALMVAAAAMFLAVAPQDVVTDVDHPEIVGLRYAAAFLAPLAGDRAVDEFRARVAGRGVRP